MEHCGLICLFSLGLSGAPVGIFWIPVWKWRSLSGSDVACFIFDGIVKLPFSEGCLSVVIIQFYRFGNYQAFGVFAHYGQKCLV